MYPFIAKGITLGQLLTRRVFRTVTGIPGLLIDVGVAIFWKPNFESYWNLEENYILYLDEVKTSPVRGFFGYVGDIIGTLLGGFAGGLISLGLYFPDLMLRGISYSYIKLSDALSNLADIVDEKGKEFFPTFEKPKKYMSKAWNVSVATLGLAIAVPIYTVSRAIQFFLTPGKTEVSDWLWKVSGFAGGLIGSIIAISLFPVKHIADRLVDLYSGFRNTIRSTTAFIYAKTNTEPVKVDEDCCTMGLHSDEFRQQVEACKELSTTTILYGTFKQRPEAREIHNNNHEHTAPFFPQANITQPNNPAPIVPPPLLRK